MDIHQTEYKGYKIYFYNRIEFDTLFEEIFIKGIYHFSTQQRDPKIIDCGSHIGLSILYFKMLYPDASVIAFEPDIRSYKVLEKNVEVNQLKDVQLYNYALTNIEGEHSFYFESDGNLDSCGNTLDQSWGDRNGFGSSMVKGVLLSDFLTGDIDFLKMDIEGSEWDVLIEVGDRLALINELALEFHIYDKDSRHKLELTIEELSTHYKVVTQHKQKLSSIMPDRYFDWVNRYNPYVCNIRTRND